MNIKKYSDDTFNVIYEVGDYAIVKHNPKYGDDSEYEDMWGEVTKIMGKPMTAKLTIESEHGPIEVYVWNVKPCNNKGKLLTKEEIFKESKITEMLQSQLTVINENNTKIIKFREI